MDLIGDIVEHEPEVPTLPVIDTHAATSGFPQLKTFDSMKPRNSRFKAAKSSGSQPAPASRFSKSRHDTNPAAEKKDHLSEAQKIHQENLAKIASLTEDEISKEREELLAGLDPKLIQSFLKRTEKKAEEDHHDHHDHAEGYDGWIGGGRGGVKLPSLSNQDVNKALGIKSVSFQDEEEILGRETLADLSDSEGEIDGKRQPLDHFTDDEEDASVQAQTVAGSTLGDDEVAPEGYQILSEEAENAPYPEVHFPKPKVAHKDPELDLDDPEFFNQLHDKYYPDLPKETSKLAWMTTPVPQRKVTSYDAISDMRFDFKGNLVELDSESQETPTHLGLHHHSDNPQLAGYTLAELVHLSRSVVPTQRCLGIQMLGRILHKLGLHKYNILPIVEDEKDPHGENSALSDASKELVGQFEEMMWDLIDGLRVIDSLTEASDEARTRNLSVRNYAIEALWLWKQGGGRPERAAKSEEEILAENLNNL